MTTLLIILAIAVLILCMIVDSCGSGNGEFWVVVCRIIGSNAKLAFKMAGCLILYFGALLGGTAILKPKGYMTKSASSGGGPETEELAGFINSVTFFPRLIVDGLIALGRVGLFIGLVCMLWVTQFLLNHLTIFFGTLAVAYVFWGERKVRKIVWEEYTCADEEKRTGRFIAALVVWSPIATSVVYVLIMAAVRGYTTPGIEYTKLW